MNLTHSIFLKSNLTQEIFAVIFWYTVTVGENEVAEKITMNIF